MSNYELDMERCPYCGRLMEGGYIRGWERGGLSWAETHEKIIKHSEFLSGGIMKLGELFGRRCRSCDMVIIPLNSTVEQTYTTHKCPYCNSMRLYPNSVLESNTLTCFKCNREFVIGDIREDQIK